LIPTLMIVEPAAADRGRKTSGQFSHQEPGEDGEALRTHLKEIRRRIRDNHLPLRNQFTAALQKFSGVRVSFAQSARAAAEQIRALTGDTNLVSINKSNVIINELRPELHALGLQTRQRYFQEFAHIESAGFENIFTDYWSTPNLRDKRLMPSFAVQEEIHALPVKSIRNYTAVLGVNAVSAEDGTIYFLQHMSNITKDMEQAGRVVLVVTVEKILPDRDAAFLHTRAMGVFGMESVLLGLAQNPLEAFDPEILSLLPEEKEREIHLLILDNGRTELLSGEYADLFSCVDCRACARQCPIGKHVAMESESIYSPKNSVLSYLQNTAPPLYACLHCGRCGAECPVDIDLPTLIWKTQITERAEKGASLAKRLLDNPEWLMKIGSGTAPFSNWVGQLKPLRRLMEHIAGVHRDAHLPSFQRENFENWYKHHGRT
jgi:L-lactate utilization protein LutB